MPARMGPQARDIEGAGWKWTGIDTLLFASLVLFLLVGGVNFLGAGTVAIPADLVRVLFWISVGLLVIWVVLTVWSKIKS